jgi:hypothetical protein
MKTRALYTAIAAASALLLVISACSEKAADSDSPGGVASASVVEVTGCKTFESNSSRSFAAPTQSCIQYEYDGESVLRFTHINAGFNCCPDSLGVSVHNVGASYTIQEIEWLLSGGCHCLCLFDMTVELLNVEPGICTLKFNEPYVLAGDNELEFTIDLAAEPSGSICVDRDRYPWGSH